MKRKWYFKLLLSANPGFILPELHESAWKVNLRSFCGMEWLDNSICLAWKMNFHDIPLHQLSIVPKLHLQNILYKLLKYIFLCVCVCVCVCENRGLFLAKAHSWRCSWMAKTKAKNLHDSILKLKLWKRSFKTKPLIIQVDCYEEIVIRAMWLERNFIFSLYNLPTPCWKMRPDF